MFYSMTYRHQSRWRPYTGLLRLIGRVLRGFEPTFLIDLRFFFHSNQGKVFLANKVNYPDLSDLPFPLFPSSLLQSSSPSTNLVFFFFPNFTFFFFFFFRPFPPLRPAKKNSLASNYLLIRFLIREPCVFLSMASSEGPWAIFFLIRPSRVSRT